jgi:hypothetical protein
MVNSKVLFKSHLDTSGQSERVVDAIRATVAAIRRSRPTAVVRSVEPEKARMQEI